MFHTIIADAPVQPSPVPTQGFEQTLMMILVAIIFFYFILWRPETKRRKELEAKRQGLKKGDRVVVAGGILGEISKVQNETVIIKLIEGAKIEVLKAAIQDVQGGTEATEKAESTTPEQK
jgi:preprotein translocase subunit YajC